MKPRAPYNPRAYEKIFETVGGYYWDRVMTESIKRDFLEGMYRWKNPALSPKIITSMANSILQLSYMEFDTLLLRDIYAFQRIYAHNERFIKFVNRPKQP